MTDAIIYQGDTGTASGDLLKNSKLKPLDLERIDIFRETFNSVYSSRI